MKTKTVKESKGPVEITLRQYATKRTVTPQAVQKAIARVKELKKPYPNEILPGVAAVTKRKQGTRHFYFITLSGSVKKGRRKNYIK